MLIAIHLKNPTIILPAMMGLSMESRGTAIWDKQTIEKARDKSNKEEDYFIGKKKGRALGRVVWKKKKKKVCVQGTEWFSLAELSR